MKITSFFTNAHGHSEFGEVDIATPLQREDEFGHTLKLSKPFLSPNVQLVELPQGMDQDWHVAPARQLVAMLSGELEVEVSSGECRRWRAGELFLPADTSGQGHRTRTIGGPVRVLFAPLADDFEITGWQD